MLTWPRHAVRAAARAIALLVPVIACPAAGAAESEAAAHFRKQIEPILTEHCSDCHAGGADKGGVAFDRFKSDAALLDNHELWWKSLKMLRAGMMPPKNKPRPSAEQLAQIEQWIKHSAFRIDPHNPDPGRVTVRRLNRVEYRNTVRDLMGVNYDTTAEFPPDDTGHGFDTIGDVLSLSPLHLEKYIAAAKAIVAQTLPLAPKVVAEHRIAGQRFRSKADAGAATGDGFLPLPYTKPAAVAATYQAEHAGRYQVVVDLTANERYVEGIFDYNKCKLVFKVDGQVVLEQEYSRQGGKPYHYVFEHDWQPDEHELTFELTPLTPKERQVRSLTLRLVAVTVRGPLAPEFWIPPSNYQRYYPKPVPEDQEGRRAYARELLRNFAGKAFRRPVDDETLDRLVKLAESIYTQPGRTFEAGIAQAVTVILASPRFLFREEGVVAGPPGTHPLIDEYALASRLSYFLWSSMPDEELFRLAGANKLRANLNAQVARLLTDPRSSEFVQNFVGQWLEARSIETVPINARAVIANDQAPDPKLQQLQARFRELSAKDADSLTDAEKKELADVRTAFFAANRRAGAGFGFGFGQDLTDDLRKSMRRETEMLFEHILRNDRNLLEILDSDYTFLNERLARHYGITGVTGDQMRLVKLPSGSPRGGVLTQGTVLVVTSNPDRTSPVKRGLFILENILGTPPAPPPPDIPPLEEAAKSGGQPLTLREALKLHRSQSLCSSCHNRMDPLGLALENFNALGRFRDKERNQPIDAAGQLITGELFNTVQELKRTLVTNHRREFFRCLTEKLFTYALGRGVEYYDTHTVDTIVERIEKADGKPSALLAGIIESAPFQRRRAVGATAAATE